MKGKAMFYSFVKRRQQKGKRRKYERKSQILVIK